MASETAGLRFVLSHFWMRRLLMGFVSTPTHHKLPTVRTEQGGRIGLVFGLLVAAANVSRSVTERAIRVCAVTAALFSHAPQL